MGEAASIGHFQCMEILPVIKSNVHGVRYNIYNCFDGKCKRR